MIARAESCMTRRDAADEGIGAMFVQRVLAR